MNRRTLTIEMGLYAAAFLLALMVRFAGVGQTPLSDSEASLALQALSVAHGTTEPLGPHAVYVMLTGLWMFLFGATDWVARFWPALMGSLFVFVPLLYRFRLGNRAALVFAFWAAFDPGLVAASLEAGSTMIAICAVYAAFGFALARRPVWTGISVGIALLAGPVVWPGIIGFGLVYWLFFAGKRAVADSAESLPRLDFRLVLIAGAAVWVLVGSLMFMVPRGLGAAGSALPLFLQGWAQPSGVSFTLMLPGLFLYEGAGIVLALIGLGRAFLRGDPLDKQLAAWAGIALLLALIYPARHVADLTWVIPPLLALASRQVARQMDIDADDRAAMVGQALLTAVMVYFAWAAGLKLAGSDMESTVAVLQWGRVAAALVLLGITTFLVGWGWSMSAARNGLQWGVTLVLGIYMLSTAFNSSGLSSRGKAEMWPADPPFMESNLLTATLRNFLEWQPSLSTALDIVVVDVPSPALRWTLRNFDEVSHLSGLPTNASPAIIITQNESQMAQSAAYRGQDFVIWRKPAWDILLGREWMTWAIYRTAPEDAESIILWVRTDLFPGGDEEALPVLLDESGIDSQ